ncbi:MAG: hypothetical protein J7K35_05440, partial [Syntrophobacterales bacterium]|nr:hypothetical protein [Syntrophobacterales bacterium]
LWGAKAKPRPLGVDLYLLYSSLRKTVNCESAIVSGYKYYICRDNHGNISRRRSKSGKAF